MSAQCASGNHASCWVEDCGCNCHPAGQPFDRNFAALQEFGYPEKAERTTQLDTTTLVAELRQLQDGTFGGDSRLFGQAADALEALTAYAMTDERHWWACAVNAPRAEWVGPCDCDLSRLPKSENDEGGQWSGECKRNDHEACDGWTAPPVGYLETWAEPCKCLCHEPKDGES